MWIERQTDSRKHLRVAHNVDAVEELIERAHLLLVLGAGARAPHVAVEHRVAVDADRLQLGHLVRQEDAAHLQANVYLSICISIYPNLMRPQSAREGHLMEVDAEEVAHVVETHERLVDLRQAARDRRLQMMK